MPPAGHPALCSGGVCAYLLFAVQCHLLYLLSDPSGCKATGKKSRSTESPSSSASLPRRTFSASFTYVWCKASSAGWIRLRSSRSSCVTKCTGKKSQPATVRLCRPPCKAFYYIAETFSYMPVEIQQRC